MEGKIRNAVKRACSTDTFGFIIRLMNYLDHHNQFPSKVLHPTHKTLEEKKELIRKRAKRKRNANKARKH